MKLHLRTRRPEVSCKKGAFRNFPKFTGKHLCQSLFFNKKLPTIFPKSCILHVCESPGYVFAQAD